MFHIKKNFLIGILHWLQFSKSTVIQNYSNPKNNSQSRTSLPTRLPSTSHPSLRGLKKEKSGRGQKFKIFRLTVNGERVGVGERLTKASSPLFGDRSDDCAVVGGFDLQKNFLDVLSLSLNLIKPKPKPREFFLVLSFFCLRPRPLTGNSLSWHPHNIQQHGPSIWKITLPSPSHTS